MHSYEFGVMPARLQCWASVAAVFQETSREPKCVWGTMWPLPLLAAVESRCCRWWWLPSRDLTVWLLVKTCVLTSAGI